MLRMYVRGLTGEWRAFFHVLTRRTGVDDNYGLAPVTGELFSFLSLQDCIPHPYTFCPYIHTFIHAPEPRRVELLSTEP